MYVVCTLIFFLNNGGPESPEVRREQDVLGWLVDSNELKYQVDFSEAMKQFPNRDKDVNWKRSWIRKDRCVRY